MSLMAAIASLNGDFNFGVTDYIKIAQQHQASKNHSESSLRNFLMQAIKDDHFVVLDNPLKKTRKTLVLSDTLKKEYRNWLNSLSKKFAAWHAAAVKNYDVGRAEDCVKMEHSTRSPGDINV